MTKIDTKYIRGRCDISPWLHDQFRIEIKDLCYAYDEAQAEICAMKLENAHFIRKHFELTKEIERLNETISTILNPHINHGVIKDITLEESK